VLLLHAKDDRMVAGIDLAFWRERAFPAGEVTIERLERGGHGFHCEFPEAAERVLEFLSQPLP